jgi:hypothetical protein
LKPGIWAVGRWRPTAAQKTAQLWRVLIRISALAGGDTVKAEITPEMKLKIDPPNKLQIKPANTEDSYEKSNSDKKCHSID